MATALMATLLKFFTTEQFSGKPSPDARPSFIPSWPSQTVTIHDFLINLTSEKIKKCHSEGRVIVSDARLPREI